VAVDVHNTEAAANCIGLWPCSGTLHAAKAIQGQSAPWLLQPHASTCCNALFAVMFRPAFQTLANTIVPLWPLLRSSHVNHSPVASSPTLANASFPLQPPVRQSRVQVFPCSPLSDPRKYQCLPIPAFPCSSLSEARKCQRSPVFLPYRSTSLQAYTRKRAPVFLPWLQETRRQLRVMSCCNISFNALFQR
jgi:hypothetical protein